MRLRSIAFITMFFVGFGCGSSGTAPDGRGGGPDGASPATDGGVLPTPNDGAAPAPDRGPVCQQGETLCGSECVNVLTDLRHCGGCDRSCDPGMLCVTASCLGQPTTCSAEGCPEDYYCDLSEDKCYPGCGQDDQCDSGERCEVTTHDCECQAGHHRCAGKLGCLPDDATDHKVCGGVCAPCPAGPEVDGLGCDGSQCVVTACKEGFLPCPSGCCPWKKEVIATGDHVGTSALAIEVDDAGGPIVILPERSQGAVKECTFKGAERQGSSWKLTDVVKGSLCYAAMLERGANGTIQVGLSYSEGSTSPFWTGSYDGTWKLYYAENTGAPLRPKALDGNGAGKPCVVMSNQAQSSSQKSYQRYGCVDDPSGSWWTKLEQVGVNSQSSYGSSGAALQLDGGNVAHVVYLKGYTQRPTYARLAGGTWTEEQIADTKAYSPALVLDAQGSPVVTFHAASVSVADVQLARRGADGTWAVEDVYKYGSSITLALDKAGNPVVGHKGNLGTSNIVRISRKTSAGWQHATVGTFNAYDMALDAAGKVHVVAMSDSQVLYFTE